MGDDTPACLWYPGSQGAVLRTLQYALEVHMLIPRYVRNGLTEEWHICMARPDFPDGKMVTLEALCGRWAIGELTHLGCISFPKARPDAHLYDECVDINEGAQE